MRRTIIVLACLGTLAAGCASGQDGTDALGNSAREATATTAAPTDAGEEGLGTPDAPAETTPAGPKTFAMGYRSTIFDDGVDTLRLTIASPRTLPADEYFKPERGRFLAVTVTYEALQPAQLINPFDLIVTTTAGERLQPTFGPDTGGAQLNSATLNTGEKAKGTVVFDVPARGLTGIAYAPAGQVIGTWKLG